MALNSLNMNEKSSGSFNLTLLGTWLANISRFFSVKKITWLLLIISISSALNVAYLVTRIKQINAFNAAVSIGLPPQTDRQSFEAKF